MKTESIQHNTNLLNNKNSNSLLVLCTCPDKAVGQQLARQLVESRLAACVNVLPELTSIYTWEEKLETATEVLLLIKTTEEVYQKLEIFLAKAHPYDCPEIIAIPIKQGLTGYLKWINETVLSSA